MRPEAAHLLKATIWRTLAAFAIVIGDAGVSDLAGAEQGRERPRGRAVMWRSADGKDRLYYDPLDKNDLLIEAAYKTEYPGVPSVDFSECSARHFKAGNMQELTAGLAAASRSGAQKFQRIFIVGHGGGRYRLPGVILWPGERFEASTLTDDCALKLKNALRPGGVLIVAACGHRLRYPGGTGKWDDSLLEIATRIGHRVCASPNTAYMSLREGLNCQIDPTQNPDGTMVLAEPGRTP
jgi:hypothetical protein